MITLKKSTVEEIMAEMESIPEKYQKPFNSTHEGLAVLREEYIELENEIFFGEKSIEFIDQSEMRWIKKHYPKIDESTVWSHKDLVHRLRIKKEAIQVAAMAARIIQELTPALK